MASVTPIAPPPGVKLKEIALCLDNYPIVTNIQLRFWEWLADYYLCSVGEVYKAALPSGLKIESETRIEIDSEVTDDMLADCTELQMKILDLLRRRKNATVESIDKELKDKGVGTAVSAMIDAGILAVSEKLVERYRVVRRPYVRPTIPRGDSEAVEKAFANVRKNRKRPSLH